MAEEVLESPTINITIPLGPTQNEFVTSPATEVVACGPRREGKSFSAYTGMVAHAKRQNPDIFPVPWCICRDTATNIHRTVVPGAYKWEVQCKTAMINQIKELAQRQDIEMDFAEHLIMSIKSQQWVKITKKSNTEMLWIGDGNEWLISAYLFGMDELKDISRFQSLELGGIWFEEPAPAADDDIGGGIQEAAWIVAMSSLNYEVDKPRAQITMNPPDEDHWTWQRFVEDNEDPDERVLLNIPRGENKHIPKWYRENIDKTLKSRPDLHRRLVQGLPGFIQKGRPVAAAFSEALHVSSVPLSPSKHTDLYLFWDFGHNPTAIGMQIGASGHFNFLFSCTSDNMGTKQFIESVLEPYLNRHIPPGLAVWHIGDPQGNERDKTDITKTPVQQIIDMLGGYWQNGPTKWEPRRRSVHDSLSQTLHGAPLVQLDPTECRELKLALRGGWHYRELPGGKFAERPEKDKHSHLGDAFSYGMAVLLARWGVTRRTVKVKAPGYGNRNHGRRMAEALASNPGE